MTMRFQIPLFIIVVSTLLLAGCSNPFVDNDTKSSDSSDLPADVQEFITLMNEHRVSRGLSSLTWNSALADVAHAHSQDMHDRGFFNHTNPDGDDPFDRMTAAGISYQAAAENIAYGYTTGQAVFNGWIGSSGHRANIENAGYTHHGVGYVEDGNYWTHLFAKNPTVN